MRLVRRRSRRPEAVEKLQLEKVIGLTSCNSSGLASNPASGDLAFLAGCVVVVFSTQASCQTRFFMVSRTPKTLACIAYSPQGGKLIAAGECGHQPVVVVWDASDGSCIAELKGHKYGISCVKFSPNGKHLLSAGFPHDGQICLFDFKSGSLISKVKVATASSPVSELHFASDGSFFVTAGSNQLKHWSMGFFASRQRSAVVGLGAHTLDGKNVNLGSVRESSFVAVTSSEQSQGSGGNEIQPIYALASTGILCLLHRGLAVKKWVNLKVRQGHSLCILGSHIACACSDGIVRIFMIETLTYLATLPRPAPLGFHDLTDSSTCVYLATHNVNGIIYPDAVACRFATLTKLVVIYADHSLFIWDIQNFSKIQKCQSFLSHSECVWDVINLPSLMNKGSDSMLDYNSDIGVVHQGSFATCSSDGSIRLWHIESAEDGICKSTVPNGNHDNVYDKSMVGVLYQDKRDEPEAKSIAANQIDSVDTSRGFRSISVSNDGRYLAAGDRGGNLHIYDLNSLQIAYFKEAHDAEILTLSFGTVAVVADNNQVVEVALLASGGRDRLVHIYNASRGFEVVETLDDHSASVTALKFACDGSKLLSSSADKSVVFRNIELNCWDIKSRRYHQEMASRGTVYDLDIDTSKKLAVTIGQDKKLNFLSLSSGKSVKSFKPEGDSGEPIKVKIDPSGTCLVCSHSDKSLQIYDISNGELLSSAQGHSEVITGVIFMPDCKRLISVSGDSCIFIWKLPSSISKMMRKRCNFRPESQTSHASMHPPEVNKKQDAMSSIGTPTNMSCADDTDTVPFEAVAASSHVGSGMPSAFKFSVSRLPHWAQVMVSQTIAEQDENNLGDCSLYSSDSRWAERLGTEGYKLFCEQEVLIPPATVLPNNFCQRRRFTIEPSASSAYSTPDSSLGSQLSGTSSFTPNVSGRKSNYWKTVHTLFFDEEYVEDGVFSDSHLLFPSGKGEELWNVDHPHASKAEQGEAENSSKDDSTVVYLSDNEQQPTMSMISMVSKNQCDNRLNSEQELSTSLFQTPAPLACMINHRSERTQSNLSPTQSCRPDFTKEIQCFPGSAKENFPELQGHEDRLDDMSDEDESGLPFCPDSNLFNSHFGNLSTAIKVQAGKASARSSFSARFFAQSSHPLPVLSLFQDSPNSDSTEDVDGSSNSKQGRISTCSLLAEEREVLKHKELQGKTLTGISTTQISSGLESLLTINQDIEELAVDRASSVLSTVNDLGPSTFFGGSSVDSQADIDQHYLHSLTVDCGVLANDRPVKSHDLSASMDDKSCAGLNLESTAQEGLLSIPCNLSSTKENDAMDIESTRGEEKNFTLDEGQTLGVSLIEESKKRSSDISTNGPGGIILDSLKPEESLNGLTLIEESKKRSSDISTNGPGSIIVDLLKPEESLNELKKALQTMTYALDKAISSCRELELMKETEGNKAVAANLCGLHEEYIPPALQKVWLLSDSMTALHHKNQETASACDHPHLLEFSRSSYSEHGSLRLSNTGTTSRPCTAASVAPTSSAFDSIDIEGFIQNYSVRFSATLANQVLALVQKGLSGHHEK